MKQCPKCGGTKIFVSRYNMDGKNMVRYSCARCRYTERKEDK
jgi:ribosomal protein S27AE